LLVGTKFMVLQWVRICGLCVGASVFGGRFLFAGVFGCVLWVESLRVGTI